VVFSSGPPHQIPVCLSPIPHACHMPRLSHSCDWMTRVIFGKDTSHKAPRYVVFSIPLFSRPYWTQISSSAPYSRTHSGFVPSSVWDTKLLTEVTTYLHLLQGWGMSGAVPSLCAFMALVTNDAVSFILQIIFDFVSGRCHCIAHAQCFNESNVTRQVLCRHAIAFLQVYWKLREKCLSVFIIVIGVHVWS